MWQPPLLVHDERSAQTVADAAFDPGSRSCPNPNPNTPGVDPAGSRSDRPTGDPIRPLDA